MGFKAACTIQCDLKHHVAFCCTMLLKKAIAIFDNAIRKTLIFMLQLSLVPSLFLVSYPKKTRGSRL